MRAKRSINTAILREHPRFTLADPLASYGFAYRRREVIEALDRLAAMHGGELVAVAALHRLSEAERAEVLAAFSEDRR